jgi:uncharacterized phiE125 gp8 family phage protein
MSHVLLFRDVRHRLRRTVEPMALPVVLDEVSRALKLGTLSDDDKAEITRWMHVAVADVEHDSQRALYPQTWQLKMDEFPCEIELRKPPIIAVTSVTYLDTDGDSQTLATTEYETDLTSEPGLIVQAENTYWPGTECIPNAVTVTFTAGYQVIPEAAFTAICLNVQARYNGCEPGGAYWANIDRLRWESGL